MNGRHECWLSERSEMISSELGSVSLFIHSYNTIQIVTSTNDHGNHCSLAPLLL